ncbi:MAG: YaaL family protein [Oscillospiraceae bacterium]|jgi:hypothetical protein|nr:YaaL family protein [Oscillospiraceae bacterium]
MKKKEARQDERGRLIEDIREVRRQLEGNHALFALETDEDLLDAAIYQREALQARYRYLLRLARETGAAAAGLPVEAEIQERWIS